MAALVMLWSSFLTGPLDTDPSLGHEDGVGD